MDTQTIATNLVRLRKDRRKTQEEVAAASGLSRGAFRSIEKGRSVPKVENLRAIARALAVPMRELVTPVARLQRVRFRSLKRLKSRDQVLAGVGRWPSGPSSKSRGQCPTPPPTGRAQERA